MPDRESPGQYSTPKSCPLTFIEKGCSWWYSDILQDISGEPLWTSCSTYDRTPCSDRNSFSSNIFSRILFNLSSLASARSNRSPLPRAAPSRQLGALQQTPLARTGQTRNVARRDVRAVLDDQSRVERNEADHGADWKLLRVTKAPLDGVVVEPVFLVPEREMLLVGGIGHRVGDEQEVFKELPQISFAAMTINTWLTFEAISSYVGLCLASSSAILSLHSRQQDAWSGTIANPTHMFKQKNAIHAVPSA
jgi:hypothetical protein